VIVLDAFGLVALLRDEPAAEIVVDLLSAGDVAIPALNLAEVIDQVVRVDGVTEREVRELIGGLIAGGLGVLHMDDETPWTAALLHARHYRRRRGALSLADCVLLASTGPRDAIATGDRPVLAAARAEGIDVMPLPDPAGRIG
jgi:PIN domain nuclease of toxin-antitoxin system